MQTHAWEPWDLLAVLGVGGAWLADFSNVRAYYQAVAAVRGGGCRLETAQATGRLIASDCDFPDEQGNALAGADPGTLTHKLAFCPAGKREETAEWLRRGSPLARRMHRNTRTTLRQYHQMGLLDAPPPLRQVRDIEYDYEDSRERDVYNAITTYIDKRFRDKQGDRAGKGFVRTVYRRRAASSPFALGESLRRRRGGLDLVIKSRAHSWEMDRGDTPEALDFDDLPEDESEGRISAALPEDPEVARDEQGQLDELLADLVSLGATDSKRGKFFSILKTITDDGRPALVFTEYADTLTYLRDSLVDYYGPRLGCYSGDGGAVWDGGKWKGITKDAITKALRAGELSVLICTDAASEGLNLQAAGAVINYDLPWNPSKVEQRIGRIDRIGQQYPEIRVVNLFLKDSVDERVYAVLRQRCSLFEHFVGAMQPVLARARRMLMGDEPADTNLLVAQADEVGSDLLANETYLEGKASAAEQPDAALARVDVQAGFAFLSGEYGPRVVRRKGKQHFAVQGLGKRLAFGPGVEALEADRAVIPASPLVPELRDLAGKLRRPGERLPLVVGSFQEGPFRSSVALWVGESELAPVDTFADLAALVKEWDGTYPDPEQWRGAHDTATRQAAAEVRRLANLAAQREAEGLRRQLDACRQRLLKELGRYLVCIEGSAADLNGVFHRQMSRDIAGARRLQLCRDRLGGYPEWDEQIRRELDSFSAELTEGRRAGRLLGSELDAALEDPRWLARVGRQ